MKIFQHPSLPFFEEQGLSSSSAHPQLNTLKIDLIIFTKRKKVSKPYPQNSNLFVIGLSVTHAETSASDFGILTEIGPIHNSE